MLAPSTLGWSAASYRVVAKVHADLPRRSLLAIDGQLFCEGSIAMKRTNLKRWLALALFCSLPITALAGSERSKPRGHHQRPANTLRVPEGGSSLEYLLGAGLVCVGAVLVRSRTTNLKQS